jgi:hypothetical protein
MSGRGQGGRGSKQGKSLLRGWIHHKKYLARGTVETNRVDEDGFSVNSHNNLAGGVLRVPLEDSDTFHQHYMDDIHEGHVFYYSENFTRVYRMCFDLDFKSEAVGQSTEDPGDLEALDLDGFEYRYGVYVEIVKTVRRFYPVDMAAEKFTVIVLEAPSKSMPETPDHPAYTKVGVHLVFPFLNVSKSQGLYMVEAATTALEHDMGKRGEITLGDEETGKRVVWQNSWEDVCDKIVHLNGNLRLPYSDKPMKCKDCDSNPACKRGGKSLCEDPFCVYQRKPENRAYTPKLVLKLNGNTDATMLKLLTSNRYRAIRMTSVRTQLTSTTPGFAPFEGCTMPPELTADGKVGKKLRKRKVREARATAGDKTYLDENDKRSRAMLDLVRKTDPHYSKLLFQSCFYMDLTSGARRFLFHVRGEGSNYCLNKADDHHSSTIYFVFSKAGIRQKCFCRKAVPRISGNPCSKWASELMVAPLDKLSVLFPDIESEFTFKGIYKRTKRGRIVKGNDDTVTFGCRRPRAQTTSSNAAKTMEDLSKTLCAQAQKMERHTYAKEEKAKRSRHVASGEAFKSKSMGRAAKRTTTETASAKGGRDYSKVLSREELLDLDWYETKCYLEAQAARQ